MDDKISKMEYEVSVISSWVVFAYGTNLLMQKNRLGVLLVRALGLRKLPSDYQG